MRAMKFFGLLGILQISVVMFIGRVHYALGDDLLFHSDLWSLIVYLGSFALFATPILLLSGLAMRWLPVRFQEWTCQAVYLAFAIAVLTLFLKLGINLAWEFRVISWQSITCLVVAVVWVCYGIKRTELIGRLQNLGILGASLACLIASMILWNHLSTSFQKVSPQDSKQLVFIVLDGFPTQYLSSYNSDVSPTHLDVTLSRSHLLREVRTCTPYTHAFFGGLYLGQMNPRDSEEHPLIDEGNLLASLQGNDVDTKWMSWHRNGIPEGCAAQIDSYRGLRSFLLTENTAWIPRVLGLDYHVMMSRWAFGWEGRARYSKVALNLTSGKREWNNIFIDHLLPEMRRMRRSGKNSFLMFHISWKSAGKESSRQKGVLSSAQREKKADLTEIKRARENDYRYEPSLESTAADMREEASRLVSKAGSNFAEFLSLVRKEELLENSGIILTADHGSIFKKGKLWYGYHPNQEVVKVLCAVFEPGKGPRVDERRFATPDVTATILDYYGIRGKLYQSAHSFLQDGPGRDYTATLTQQTISGNRHERWLVIVRADMEYWFNIDPGGAGEAKGFLSGTFNQVEVPLGTDPSDQGIAPEIRSIIHKALDDFGVPKKEIHERYRQ